MADSSEEDKHTLSLDGSPSVSPAVYRPGQFVSLPGAVCSKEIQAVPTPWCLPLPCSGNMAEREAPRSLDLPVQGSGCS